MKINESTVGKDFFFNWYHHDDEVVNLPYLKEVLQKNPKALYKGPAFRVAEFDENGKPWVKPPTSWSKTLNGTKEYLKTMDVYESDAEDIVVITGNIYGLDFTVLSEPMANFDDYMIQSIRKVEEVVALKMPTNVKSVYKIEPNTKRLIPITESVKIRDLIKRIIREEMQLKR